MYQLINVPLFSHVVVTGVLISP